MTITGAHLKKRQGPSFIIYTILSATLIIQVLIVSLVASTPPSSRDALIHHLYVPKLWLQYGSIHPIPDIVFSYYPMNLDLLYMIPLSFGNDIIPAYIHFAFAILTSLLIFNYLKRRLNKTWALLGSLFFLSLPIIIKLSITVYVDLGIIFFSTASLLSLFRWAESHKFRYLILAGICCGLAAGTKYNALISIFILTLLTPLIYIRLGKPRINRPSLHGIFYAFIFFSITLMIYSPWLIRNYQTTGNPIYPLYESVFQKNQNQTNTPDEDTLQPSVTLVDTGRELLSRRSSKFAQRKANYHETWWQSLLLPVRFFFEGRDDDPRYFDGKLNPFLLIFMLFSFYHYRYSEQTRKEQWFLLAFGWLFFFFTFFQEALRIRYIATCLPSFVILATFGLHNIYARLSRINSLRPQIARFCVTLLGTAALGYNGIYLLEQFTYYQPLEYISGKISRDEYLSRYLIDYPVQKYAAENLKPDAHLLAVYVGRRGYYFEQPVTFDPINSKSLLGDIIQSAQSPQNIYQQLLDHKFSHLFIRFDLFNKIASRNLDLTEIQMFNEFLERHTTQLFANAGEGQSYVLFRIHPTSD